MKHSTGKPNKREAEYIERCKTGPCVACWVNSPGRISWDGGCNDFHHMKSGNIRRGHMFGIGLCRWHHMGHPFETWPMGLMRESFGPSLMDGSRLFHLTYGSDDDLLKLQRELIGWEDELAAD